MKTFIIDPEVMAEFIERLDLSQRKFALDIINTDPSQFNRYMKGTPLSISTIEKWKAKCKALEAVDFYTNYVDSEESTPSMKVHSLKLPGEAYYIEHDVLNYIMRVKGQRLVLRSTQSTGRDVEIVYSEIRFV